MKMRLPLEEDNSKLTERVKREIQRKGRTEEYTGIEKAE
jgi:hypothetical protein